MSETTWLLTGPMADELGISIRTIHHYKASEQSPWIEGRHYKRRTPADKSPWIWDRHLTIKAWEEARRPTKGAA